MITGPALEIEHLVYRGQFANPGLPVWMLCMQFAPVHIDSATLARAEGRLIPEGFSKCCIAGVLSTKGDASHICSGVLQRCKQGCQVGHSTSQAVTHTGDAPGGDTACTEECIDILQKCELEQTHD